VKLEIKIFRLRYVELRGAVPYRPVFLSSAGEAMCSAMGLHGKRWEVRFPGWYYAHTFARQGEVNRRATARAIKPQPRWRCPR